MTRAKITGIAVLMLWAPAIFAQVVLDPVESARARQDFEPRAGEQVLRCDVTPLGPMLNLAFRFQAGYFFHVPQSLYSSSTAAWTVLTAITPESAPGRTTYLLGHSRLSDVARVGSSFEIQGDYFLGPGRYSVQSIIRDDHNAVCRKQWHILVESSEINRDVPTALAPNVVRQFSPIIRPDVRHKDSAALMRLTLLLNAAPLSSRRVVIEPVDLEEIAGAFTALIEHLPTSSVRVVVFSLEQQQEIFRSENFVPAEIAGLAEAILALRTAAVDASKLRDPHGQLKFLAGLLSREPRGTDGADTVVFLGPTSRYGEKISKRVVPLQVQARTRFFYLKYEVPRGIPARAGSPMSGGSDRWTGESLSDPTLPKVEDIGGLGFPQPATGLPDLLTALISQLKGRTMIIQRPVDLARAIRTIERNR